MIKKILISQPYPTSEKSPYFDIEKKYGIEIIFHPFIKVEGLSAKEFRQQKLLSFLLPATQLTTSLLCVKSYASMFRKT